MSNKKSNKILQWYRSTEIYLSSVCNIRTKTSAHFSRPPKAGKNA